MRTENSMLAPVLLLICLVAMMRLLPHPMNVTPIGALGLFAGAFLPPRFAWLAPIAALFIGDLLIGFYALPVMGMVYVGFLAGPLIGRLLLAQRRTVSRTAAAVLLSASVFFVLSNFGVWLMYEERTLATLAQCYAQAIPFFGRSLFGDALYALLLFGSYELIRRWQQHHVTA